MGSGLPAKLMHTLALDQIYSKYPRQYSSLRSEMAQAFDIAIRRARLRGHGDRLAEIGIRDGRIKAIAERLDGKGATEIDACGNLVTESFVNPHLHLCKV